MASYCSRCGAELPISAAFCPKCQHTVANDVFPQDESHPIIIGLMWLLTLGYFGFLSAEAAGMSSLCGFSSFVMGIYLVTRKNGTDKTNGWLRVGIGLVIGLVIFVQLTQRR